MSHIHRNAWSHRPTAHCLVDSCRFTRDTSAVYENHPTVHKQNIQHGKMAESCVSPQLKSNFPCDESSSCRTNGSIGGDMSPEIGKPSWNSVTLAGDFRSPSYDEDCDVFPEENEIEVVGSLQPWFKQNETTLEYANHSFPGCDIDRRTSIVDDLLFEIYDRWQDTRRDSFDSDFTECSSTSEFFHGRHSFVEVEGRNSDKLHSAVLEVQSNTIMDLIYV